MSPHLAAGLRAGVRLAALSLLVGSSTACEWNPFSSTPHTVTPAETAASPETASVDGPPVEDTVVEGELPPGAPAPRTKTTATAPAGTARKASSLSKKPSASAKASAAAKTPAPVTPKPSVAAIKPTAPPQPSPPKRVALPSTRHVRYIVGSGMQKLVDKDPRIVSWLRRITPVLDKCYRGLSGSPTGTVKVAVTMHENRRPGVALASLPGSLAGMMPCATSKLMGTRAPLFTGPEGQRHTISIRFQ